MSTHLAVEIKGVQELKAAFAKAPGLFIQTFDKTIKQSVFTLLGSARTHTPVDTGFLRETGMQTTFEALVGTLENTAPYAVYVHEGTKHMAARPFFDQSIADSQNSIDNFIEKAIQEFTSQL